MQNPLWAKHPLVKFKPIVLYRELCTVIENAPDTWGVRLMAVGCIKVGQNRWLYPSLLSESQFYSIDPAILLYRMTNREASVLKQLLFAELRTENDVLCLLQLSPRARTLIGQDLFFETSLLLSAGQIDTLIESHVIGIRNEYFEEVSSAIDFAIRRSLIPFSNKNEESNFDEDTCKEVYLANYKDQTPELPLNVVNLLDKYSVEHFSNRGRKFIIFNDCTENPFLQLTSHSNSFSKYPPIYVAVQSSLTESTIELGVEELLKLTQKNVLMLDSISSILLASTEAVASLAIIRDLESETRDACFFDSAAVIESASLINIGKLFSCLTVAKCQSDEGGGKSIVFLRCNVTKSDQGIENDCIQWLPLITTTKGIDTKGFGLARLWDMWLDTKLSHIETAVNAGQISNAELKSARALTNLFNRVSCFKEYSCLRVKTNLAWFDGLDFEVNAWVARDFVRRLASGANAIAVLRRDGRLLEIHDYVGSFDEGADLALMSQAFNLNEIDNFCVISIDHIYFNESHPEFHSLKYVSSLEMMEMGWSPGKAVLYSEVERACRKLINSESVLGHFARFELELTLGGLFRNSSIGLQDLVSQVVYGFSDFLSKRTDSVELFGLSPIQLLSLSGRMRLDDYLRGIDWPDLVD